MSRASSIDSSECSDLHDEHTALLKPKEQNKVMDLPNASIAGALGTIDEEKLGSDAPTSKGTVPNNRYDGLPSSGDMMSGGYNYSDIGYLARPPPGSVARAHAMAKIRLQEISSPSSDTTLPVHPGTLVPVGSTTKSEKADGTLQGRDNLSIPPNDGAELAVSTPSDKTVTFAHEHHHSQDHDVEPHKPSGKWRCCKCHRGHEIFSFPQGRHPISTLNCVCTHRSCSKCSLEGGIIKQFVPMAEPEIMPLSEDSTKSIRAGVVCDACGLSWRAQEVQDKSKDQTMMKATLQRISAMPRRLTKHGANPLERLRRSQSMQNLSLSPPRLDIPLTASKSVLNLRALSSEMEKEHGQQAELVSVKFAGIKCSCGFITDASSLCYQVVDPPRDLHRVVMVELMAKRNVAGFTTTPEDEARGHGTPVLTLRGKIRHPNPLRSCPVTEDDLL